MRALAGSQEKVTDGWDEIDYHGYVEFHTSIPVDNDRRYISYKAKFTDGKLVEFERNHDRGKGS